MRAHENALRQLYEAHAPALRRYARRRVGPQESEDMVHDVYLRLLQEGREAQALEHPRAYLFRIASNIAIDARRRARVRGRIGEEAPCLVDLAESMTNPDMKIERFMELNKLRASLEELPALSNKVFLFKHVGDLTHAEIASRLGVSIRTVERHLAKAMSHLRLRCGR